MASIVHRRAHGRRRSRGEEGLTTLEWLLVVAAVAGLAALAVVLVRDVADDTAETLRTVNRRQLAFDLATTELTERWAAETPATREEAERINRRYERYCRDLGIIYADVLLKATPTPGLFNGVDGWGPQPKDLPACAIHQ